MQTLVNTHITLHAHILSNSKPTIPTNNRLATHTLIIQYPYVRVGVCVCMCETTANTHTHTTAYNHRCNCICLARMQQSLPVRRLQSHIFIMNPRCGECLALCALNSNIRIQLAKPRMFPLQELVQTELLLLLFYYASFAIDPRADAHTAHTVRTAHNTSARLRVSAIQSDRISVWTKSDFRVFKLLAQVL